MQNLELQTFTNQQYSFTARGGGEKAFASSFNYESLSCFFLAGDTESPEKRILGRIALSQQNKSLQQEGR